MKHKWSPNNINYTYTYDQGTNGIGRLYQEFSNPNLAGTTFGYDPMGRVSSTQWFKYTEQSWKPGMGMQYDLAGNATQLTYPNGTVLQQAWDGAGRLQSVTDATPGGQGTVYFQPDGATSQYWPSGALQRAKLGNGVVEWTDLNSRLQPCHMQAESPVQTGAGIVLDTFTNMGILLNRQLYYGQTAEAPCGAAAGNNGNIWHIGEENGGGQNFSYDGLNRLTSAYSSNRPSNSSYNFLYSYDSFGNMVPADQIDTTPGYSIDAGTNRMLNGTDITYYPNGWVNTANNHLFWYTAEGYLSAIDQWQTASYLYNAGNERTMKLTQPGGLKWDEYVYLGGQVMADITNAGTWTNYVYANGQKIARVVGQPANPTVSYYLTDHLGTAQMELDATGAPTWTGWFTPFGQEITSGSWAPNYIGPQPGDGTGMRFKFTGLERDQETGLDHAMARYYASPLGRWMSPDPYDGSMDFSNPQSLNRYSYVYNTPLTANDPSGLMPLPCGFTTGGGEAGVTWGGIGTVGASTGGIVFAGIEAAGCLYSFVDTLVHVFSRPKFTSSHTPRPSASDSNWLNSDTFGVPYQGLLQPRTLEGGCEFGACAKGLTGAYPNGQPSQPGDFPSIWSLPGAFWWAIKDTFTFRGPQPSPSCAARANYRSQTAFPGTRVSMVKGGLIGTATGYALGAGISGAAAGGASGVYVDTAWDRSLRDAYYRSDLQACMAGH